MSRIVVTRLLRRVPGLVGVSSRCRRIVRLLSRILRLASVGLLLRRVGSLEASGVGRRLLVVGHGEARKILQRFFEAKLLNLSSRENFLLLDSS